MEIDQWWSLTMEWGNDVGESDLSDNNSDQLEE